MKKKFFIGLFIVAAVGLLSLLFFMNQANSEYQPQQNIQAPIEIPDTGITTYQEVTDTEKPIVAMFYVDWCGYCRRFMPNFGKMAKKFNKDYNFVVINCDNAENLQLVKDYHIMGFPTVYMIDNKLNHSFTLNMAGTEDLNIMKEELTKYTKFRNGILEKLQ